MRLITRLVLLVEIALILRNMSGLLGLVNLQQQKLPHPDPEIEELVEEIDLEYLVEDLPKILGSMEQGIGRLKDISLSLRTFARSDISSMVEFRFTKELIVP